MKLLLTILFIIVSNIYACEIGSEVAKLKTCDPLQLRISYTKGDCCNNPRDGCTALEQVWWEKVRGEPEKPLCNPERTPLPEYYSHKLRHPEHDKHFKKRLLLKKIISRRLRKRGVRLN